MAGIQSSTGLISGVPIQDTVDQLMKIAAQPRDRLTAKNAALQSQQVAIGQLTALIIGVQLSTDQLGRETLFEQTKVQSSSPALAATSTGKSLPGRYQFVPIRQAQQQQFTSSPLASADQLVGAGQIEVHAGGFLDGSVALDDLNGGAGVSRGEIRITDRSGASAKIDLRFAHTAADVADAINSASDIRVSAKLDGDRFTLVDSSGGTGQLTVSEVGTGVTARDLGLSAISVSANSASGTDVVSITRTTSLRTLLDGRGLRLGTGTGADLKITLQDGSTVDVSTSLSSNNASVGQLIDVINKAGGDKLRASVNGTGNGLQLEDLTSGSGTFAVTSPDGNLARDLGWDGTATGNLLAGAQLQSGLGDVLLGSLGGGSGLGTLGGLTLADRSGATANVDLSGAKTIGQVVSLINAAGIGVSARWNDSRTGITLVDTSGGTAVSLSATSSDATDTAAKLGLGPAADPSKIVGSSLQRQWINENTLLSDWNQGRGLQFGSIKFTNSAGKQSAVNLATAAPKTIGDVLKVINGAANGFEARINETGDGLLLVDTAGGEGKLEVVDVGNGSTAKQLRIAGTSQSLSVEGATVSGIDGSLDFKISTTASTTVTELVTKINESGGSISANLLSLGSGGVRLAVSSGASGERGRLALDSSSLAIAFSQTVAAQDALMSVGGSATGGGILISSPTDDFKGVVPGVTVTVKEATRTAVTVEVQENNDGITKQMTAVVDQFNKMRDKYSELTSFDSGNFNTGLLFGSPEALRIDLAFSRLFTGTQVGNGPIRSIAELGISFNDQGKLEFNKERLEAALERDADAVKQFLSTKDTGFSAKAKAVADTLTGLKGGMLLQTTTTLQTKIELNSSRIESLNKRLENERTRMLKQFYAMEASIAKIQSNLSAISKIVPITMPT